MVRVGYLWHGPSCEVALQVKNTKGKGGINTVNALAFDDNRPPYEMAKPSTSCRGGGYYVVDPPPQSF